LTYVSAIDDPGRFRPNFLLVTFPISVQHFDISGISHTCAAADVPITGYSHAGIRPLSTACLTG
jgi:hypothetical protein